MLEVGTPRFIDIALPTSSLYALVNEVTLYEVTVVVVFVVVFVTFVLISYANTVLTIYAF